MFTRYIPRPVDNTPRRSFYLIGTLLKAGDHYILVQKANSNARFGIEKNGKDIFMSEGDKGTFTISIETYPGKEDDIIRTKAKLQGALKLDGEIQNDHPGFICTMEGLIKDYQPTDINSLWMIEFDSQGEKYFLRYFSDKEPLKKPATIEVDLRSTSKMCDMNGNVYESKKDLIYNDKEGNEVKRKVNRWFTSLEIKNIKYLF